MEVSADGHGVVSHAGMGLLRELADRTGLSAQVTAALADTYRGPWVYAPGDVFADLLSKRRRGTHVIVLINNRDIRVLDRNTGQLIRKLTLDPNRDYQPRGVKCGNSPENRLTV